MTLSVTHRSESNQNVTGSTVFRANRSVAWSDQSNETAERATPVQAFDAFANLVERDLGDGDLKFAAVNQRVDLLGVSLLPAK